jgi:hypothetical protein
MSVQLLAVASQKFTCPGVTGVEPASTVAVSVTTLPEATVVTVLPAEVTARVVEVTDFVCAAALIAKTADKNANAIVFPRIALLSFDTQLRIRGPNGMKYYSTPPQRLCVHEFVLFKQASFESCPE